MSSTNSSNLRTLLLLITMRSLALAGEPPGMVWIPAGEFTMGAADAHAMPNERPARRVRVEGFWIDATPVTNAQFRKFIDATKYLTVAERKPDPKDFPGVPEDKLEAIFEPFVQIGRDFSSAQSGTGLGLAISRDLAHRMNGELTVESTAGSGSVFSLTLPRQIENAAARERK